MSHLVKREDKFHDKNGNCYCNMEFMFFSKYISCDSAADLFLMDLIN